MIGSFEIVSASIMGGILVMVIVVVSPCEQDIAIRLLLFVDHLLDRFLLRLTWRLWRWLIDWFLDWSLWSCYFFMGGWRLHLWHFSMMRSWHLGVWSHLRLRCSMR